MTLTIPGTFTVRASTEHTTAIYKAIRILEAEQATLNRWGFHSAELGLAIEDLTELMERMTDAARLNIGRRAA
jgi:hypothetical protein